MVRYHFRESTQVRQGTIAVDFRSGQRPVRVVDGLIHDWIAAAFVPDATVEQALKLVQDYNNHKSIYKPEVIASRLLNHHGDDFQIYLRLLKKKIITVVLDTYHDVHYSSSSLTRWHCRSYTTRVLEVEEAGSPKERTLPPDSATDFCGVCVLTGVLRRKRTAYSWSVEPFHCRAACLLAWGG